MFNEVRIKFGNILCIKAPSSHQIRFEWNFTTGSDDFPSMSCYNVLLNRSNNIFPGTASYTQCIANFIVV
jgi:hypothetical protein